MRLSRIRQAHFRIPAVRPGGDTVSGDREFGDNRQQKGGQAPANRDHPRIVREDFIEPGLPRKPPPVTLATPPAKPSLLGVCIITTVIRPMLRISSNPVRIPLKIPTSYISPTCEWSTRSPLVVDSAAFRPCFRRRSRYLIRKTSLLSPWSSSSVRWRRIRSLQGIAEAIHEFKGDWRRKQGREGRRIHY